MTANPNPADAVREALDALSLLANFAYENGYHELGYSPETVIRDHIAALTAQVAELELKVTEEKRTSDALNGRLAALAGAAPVDWVVRCRRTGRVVWSDPSRSTAEGYARTIAHRMPDNTLDTEVIPLFTHAPAKAREVKEIDVERAREARMQKRIDLNGALMTANQIEHEAMRAALATFAEGAE